LSSESAIIPWHVGEAQAALDLSKQLLNQGVYVPAIRFPTVAREAARLRITVTAKHDKDELKMLADQLIAVV